MDGHLKPLEINTEANQNQQRLFSLINSMADAVIAVDDQLRIALYNASALNLLDINNIKANEKIEHVLKPVDKNGHSVDIKKMILSSNNPLSSRDLKLRYQDGSEINLYLSISPVKLAYGQAGPNGYTLLMRDITREKSLEEERDEFISVISHELRTPVAITEGNISNAIFMTSKKHESVDVTKALKEAHNQVLFLSDLINDLATLSRAERGKLIVEPEDINVHSLISEIKNNYEPQIVSKNLKLNVSIDPELELLHSSKLYVREILQNLLTNSIKYTTSGHINISAKKEDNGVLFVISDTGIGISRNDQDKVFNKFFRSQDYRTAQSNGTGLGLYVTSKLARLLNAKVELNSELNKGTSVSVHIPNYS